MTEKAVLSDYDELLSFENRVFRIYFQKKVPKLYRDREKCVSYHGVVKQNNTIVGGIAAYPTQLITVGSSLRAVGIGSVAVDSKCRGQGIMREMMEYCDEVSKQQNADIGFLSGYKMRYERYGYVPGGLKYTCVISDYFINHNHPKKRYNFIPLKKCRNLIPEMIKLHNSQGTHWLRRDDEFEIITTTWFEHCFAVLDESGKFCGYVISERIRKRLSEIVLSESNILRDVLLSYAEKKNCKTLHVSLCEGQYELRREINLFAEDLKIESPAAFKVYNFKNFIEVMMNEKLRHEKLCEGTIILKIENDVYSISVRDGKCTVELSEKVPELILSYSEAVAALTTHYYGLYDNCLFRAWSPMCPISIPHIDEV